ncbi:MAG: arginine repressor [Bacteroidaceae bacterium]|nr:arginine repressor [Bacteroidaceae bacterium]MCF0196969.1 arginine repressor [Bacteroidaceae bacterium]
MRKRPDTKERLQRIRQVISWKAIERQEDLMRELEKEGFPCTQSMLSRDLRQLRISKVRRKDGVSVYALPTEGQFVEVPSREERDDSLWSAQVSGNMLVLHTPPGHASMVAYDIDSAKDTCFLGTVAGDDTVLVVLAEGVSREEVAESILRIVPTLKKKKFDYGKR